MLVDQEANDGEPNQIELTSPGPSEVTEVELTSSEGDEKKHIWLGHVHDHHSSMRMGVMGSAEHKCTMSLKECSCYQDPRAKVSRLD